MNSPYFFCVCIWTCSCMRAGISEYICHECTKQKSILDFFFLCTSCVPDSLKRQDKGIGLPGTGVTNGYE